MRMSAPAWSLGGEAGMAVGARWRPGEANRAHPAVPTPSACASAHVTRTYAMFGGPLNPLERSQRRSPHDCAARAFLAIAVSAVALGAAPS